MVLFPIKNSKYVVLSVNFETVFNVYVKRMKKLLKQKVVNLSFYNGYFIL